MVVCLTSLWDNIQNDLFWLQSLTKHVAFIYIFPHWSATIRLMFLDRCSIHKCFTAKLVCPARDKASFLVQPNRSPDHVVRLTALRGSWSLWGQTVQRTRDWYLGKCFATLKAWVTYGWVLCHWRSLFDIWEGDLLLYKLGWRLGGYFTTLKAWSIFGWVLYYSKSLVDIWWVFCRYKKLGWYLGGFFARVKAWLIYLGRHVATLKALLLVLM